MKKIFALFFALCFFITGCGAGENIPKEEIVSSPSLENAVQVLMEREEAQGYCDFPDIYSYSSLYSTYYFVEFLKIADGFEDEIIVPDAYKNDLPTMSLDEVWYFANICGDQFTVDKDDVKLLKEIFADTLKSGYTMFEIYNIMDISEKAGIQIYDDKEISALINNIISEDSVQCLMDYCYLLKLKEEFDFDISTIAIPFDLEKAEKELLVLYENGRLPVTLIWEYLCVCEAEGAESIFDNTAIYEYIDSLASEDGGFGLFPGMGGNAMPIYYVSEIVRNRELEIDFSSLIDKIYRLRRADGFFVDYMIMQPDVRSTYFACATLKLQGKTPEKPDAFLENFQDEGIYYVLLKGLYNKEISYDEIEDACQYLLSISDETMGNHNIERQWLYLACELLKTAKNNDIDVSNLSDKLVEKAKKNIDTEITDSRYMLFAFSEIAGEDLIDTDSLEREDYLKINNYFTLAYAYANSEKIADYLEKDDYTFSEKTLDFLSMENLFQLEFYEKIRISSK